MKERLFFGIPLSDQICTKIRQIQEELKKQFKYSKIQWVSIENCHITLHFLGDSKTESISELKNKIRELELPKPFELRILNVDAFPSKKDPKILIIKTDPHPSLFGLYKKIGDVIVGLGFEIDERPFTPHITLGRVTTRSEVLKTELIDVPNLMSIVNRVVLYRSDLTPTGSKYSELESFDL